PSFGGRFLPTEREVSPSGFTAQWQVSALQTSAAAEAEEGKALSTLDAFSVELIDSVNPYLMSDRAIKYGLMFIALTFVTVGLTEL
ncbi:inner membrane CreD family protein, partial [Klebsiella pneumoniae]|uniref:inner membrane CreD family protein n=1 Tax=Klebsiella pneumoniae TaxID=573 RepID=UPI0027314BC2